MIFKKLKYLISIIISVYLFAQIGENIYISGNYLNIVKDKSLLFFFLIIVFMPIFYLLTIKLMYLVSHLKKINFTSSLKATIIAYNFNLFLPAKSGDFFRHKCLNLKISFKKFFEINIVEKIISLFVLSLYVIFGFFCIQFPQNVIFDFNSIYFYLIFFLLLLIGLGSFVYFYNRIDFNLHKILKLLLYDFFIWFLQFVQIIIIMIILDINIKIYEVFFIFGVAIIAGLIPISIGGFGVRDYVIFYLFSYMDIKVDIFIMLLLFNTRYLFPVFIGFFISIYNLKNAK